MTSIKRYKILHKPFEHYIKNGNYLDTSIGWTRFFFLSSESWFTACAASSAGRLVNKVGVTRTLAFLAGRPSRVVVEPGSQGGRGGGLLDGGGETVLGVVTGSGTDDSAVLVTSTVSSGGV